MTKATSHADVEIIALQALAFIAADASLLKSFTSLTGISVENLHARAGERDVLAAAVNWLMQNESALLMFCYNNTHPPELIHTVANVLENGTTQRDQSEG